MSGCFAATTALLIERYIVWFRSDVADSDTEVPLNGTGSLIAAEATAKAIGSAAEGHTLCNGLNGRMEGRL